MDKIELVYYKKNVNYPIGVRLNALDSVGKLLTDADSWIAIDASHIRDFKVANKRAILEGLIVPTEEPNLDWETPNALSDEQIDDLIRNFLKLKSILPTLTSFPTLYRVLNRAKEQNKSTKILSLINNRFKELGVDVDSEVVTPSEMEGVTWDEGQLYK